MGDDEYIKIFAPMVHRAADKFFKFASWAILISVIDYAQRTMHSRPLFYLHTMAILIFTLSLMLQSMYVMVRSPADWGIPLHLHVVSKIMQVVAGLAMMSIIASPYLIVDSVINDLANLKSLPATNSNSKLALPSCTQLATANASN